MFVSLSGQGAAIVGHDCVDEFLVVGSVGRSVVAQGFDLRDRLTAEHLGIPRYVNFTGPSDLWHATIERSYELA